MIQLTNINKSYGKNIILKDVSFCFENKGLYLLKGESGSGKTTLLNIIDSRIGDYKGSVDIQGKIFFLSYGDYLIDEMRVKEMIDFHKCINENFKPYQKDFGISKFENKIISKLSGGEKQKLGIYLALSSNRENILLDEPFVGIDKDTFKEIVQELKRVSKNRLIIIVSHQDIKGCKEVLLENNRLVGNYKCKKIKKNNEEIKKVKLLKWTAILHKKQWIDRMLFILSIIGILTTNLQITDNIDNIKNEFFSSISKNQIKYQESDTTLNFDVFYNEIISPLAYEIDDYFYNFYSKKMIDSSVYSGKDYISNGTLFSVIGYNSSLKDDEVIVQLNELDYCKDNMYLYCNKHQIKEKLIGSILTYKINDDQINYKIKDIIFSSNESVYVFDREKLIQNLKIEYEEYYIDYYILVKNEYLRSFYEKINNQESLLSYDFHFISENESSTCFWIKESEHKYFNEDYFYSDDIIACNEIGYSCTSFDFGTLNSLYSINDIVVKGLVKYEKVSGIDNYDEIVISSALSKKINKNNGDVIDLNFYFDDEFHVLNNVYIKDVIEDNDFIIYHNNYDYNLYKDRFNKYLRINYVYGNVEGAKVEKSLGYEIVKDAIDYFNDISIIIKISFYVICLISFSILFILETHKLNKHLQVFRCLYFNKIEYELLLKQYLMIYLLFSLLLINDIVLFLIYIGMFIIFYYYNNKKIKSRFPWI